VKAAHDRAFLGAEGVCGLAVGKADDVDRDERFTQWLGDVLKCRVYGGAIDDLADRIAGCLKLVESITSRDGERSSRPSGTDPCVPEHRQEIGQILVAAQEAGTAQNLLVGVLDEILRVLARSAQPVGGAV